MLTKQWPSDKIHLVPDGTYALVAQLDRVTDYESVGKGKGGGIGLLNVQSSVKKYDGNLILKSDGNKFIAELFLNS